MSRKYRHQGYQDSSSRDDRPAERAPKPYENLTQEEKIQRRSLRRATERSANEVVRCQVCGHSVQNFGTIVPTSVCPNCDSPLHCCRTCRNFDSASRWQCHAEITEAVANKGGANECTLYAPRLVLDSTGRRSADGESGGTTGERRPSGGNDPKSQFENLFKR